MLDDPIQLDPPLHLISVATCRIITDDTPPSEGIDPVNVNATRGD